MLKTKDRLLLLQTTGARTGLGRTRAACVSRGSELLNTFLCLLNLLNVRLCLISFYKLKVNVVGLNLVFGSNLSH